MALLQIADVTHYFGGLRAVHDFGVEFEGGEIRGLIGPNGAGKTTIFNLITGVYTPTEGDIRFNGRNIIGLQPYEISAMGVARTFQNMRLWRHMTALEHIQMAHYSRVSYGLLGAFFATARRQAEEEEIKARSYDLLGMMAIQRFADQVVLNLPYGVQRRIEIARALATGPQVLLLDEPTAGMNPEEMVEMIDVIRQIKEQLDLTIFLIEHRMKVVMDLCEIIQTLNFGEVIAEGTPEEIRNDPAVIEAYLGEEAVA